MEIKNYIISRNGESILRKKIYIYYILISTLAVILTYSLTSVVHRTFANTSVFIPVMSVTLIFIIVLCVLTVYYIANKIIQPIEELTKDINDIDEKQVYEEFIPLIKTIKEQNSDIIKNDNLRSEFTANITHELKTPLTAILGYSELIDNGMASKDDVARFGKEIYKNSKRLLSLIDDIIKLSEIDSVYHQIEFEEVNLYNLACECVDMLQITAEKNNVTLSITGSNQIIRANKTMIEDLVYNLCENAIRYNKKNGNVEVIVDNKENEVYLTVKDTGIGISKKHQKRVFERFYRVDKSRSKSTGGTGLGLAIVKHIVAQHNATIDLKSLPGIGTTIKVIFNK